MAKYVALIKWTEVAIQDVKQTVSSAKQVPGSRSGWAGG